MLLSIFFYAYCHPYISFEVSTYIFCLVFHLALVLVVIVKLSALFYTLETDTFVKSVISKCFFQVFDGYLENEFRVAGWNGWLGSLGRSCIHCYIQNGQPTRTCCVSHRTLLNVTCWLG